MTKVKTSIYIDRELWEKFKNYALRKGIEVSSLLESLIKDEMLEEVLNEALVELTGHEGYELDFEPVKPKEGSVSELVRAMRDERANSLPG